jgi:rhodanese-related sulfurtransferase
MSDEISVTQLKARRDAKADFVLLDVREPDEVATARLEPSVAIPMGQVQARLAELPRDKEIVVLCHSGFRSDRVARYLRSNGFSNVLNLAGGIDAWSVEVDPAIPRY